MELQRTLLLHHLIYSMYHDVRVHRKVFITISKANILIKFQYRLYRHSLDEIYQHEAQRKRNDDAFWRQKDILN